MNVGRSMFRLVAGAAPRVAPLRIRKTIARIVNRVPAKRREQLILALLDDWATADPAQYHRFLWSNHLSYARFYDRREIDIEVLNPLRLELVGMACDHLRSTGLDPQTDIRSFVDVGCSLGYLPRYAETTAFPGASRILGIDIDSVAVAEGVSYLRSVGSRVELRVDEATQLDVGLGSEMFDVVTCTGVLQYLEQEDAASAIAAILRHTHRLVCVSGPAAPDIDNATLEQSQIREYDRSYVHNFDRMVERAGGHVVARRWGGRELVLGNSVYLVVAEPARR